MKTSKRKFNKRKIIDPWFMELMGHRVGNFTLEEYIGSGKVGCVYKACDSNIERDVAVKVIHGSPKEGWENELVKVSKLSTIPGVVNFKQLGTEQIKHKNQTKIFQYTVWDFISPGRNLKQYLEQHKSCPTSFLIAVIERILLVLHACMAKGVNKHGDLHAGNILIGEKSEAELDPSTLEPREPIYISDFGYGTSRGKKKPKDDYKGLAEIGNLIIEKIQWDEASPTDRQRLDNLRITISKHLLEQSETERRSPKELLEIIRDCKKGYRQNGASAEVVGFEAQELSHFNQFGGSTNMQVGQFQVSEMLGDVWARWKRLFVPTVPARSRILEPDISTVVTGPRGCGKTMLFRRQSARLNIECGPVEELPDSSCFVGFYVNANDIADVFSNFPATPDDGDAKSLISFTNLCILSDFLAVQSARSSKFSEDVSDDLLVMLKNWLIQPEDRMGIIRTGLVVGEDPLENYRSALEKIKWGFLKGHSKNPFPGFDDFSQHVWGPRFFQKVRIFCPWLGSQSVFLFIDDYTTPRVSPSMQRVLNRILFLRSSEFVCKVATESATTFVAEDSSGKQLQDGDDYQLIDMGEESLFMSEDERSNFLKEVFLRRLSMDSRVPISSKSLPALLGNLGLSKTEFARRLRNTPEDSNFILTPAGSGTSQRRGATKPQVLYYGWDVFTSLWSGDTRTMIQLVQELLEEVSASPEHTIACPIDPETQDRVFRNRGGQWLEAQTRNQPTDRATVEKELSLIRATKNNYNYTGGSYGSHLKAIVEAFVSSARKLLLGPTYQIGEGESKREVPRMAFRIEIIDEFRLSGLAKEFYTDLIRYGLFMRDARGKSVRGAMVPRLYLRRLLLPFCTLALSKRDSVQMSCENFLQLLLEPDELKRALSKSAGRSGKDANGQIEMPFSQIPYDIQYEDFSSENN